MVQQAATTADSTGQTFQSRSVGCWESDGEDDDMEDDTEDASIADDTLVEGDGASRRVHNTTQGLALRCGAERCATRVYSQLWRQRVRARRQVCEQLN